MHGLGEKGGARGIGLVELLVAVGLFAIVTAVVLAQYAAVRRAQKIGDGMAELQQAVRAGCDRLKGEVRMAGLGVDPDGALHRPDEAIEAAFAAAVVIRADFDGKSADASVPELSLAQGGPFRNVTTGNDEILGYVLAKADGSSPDTLAFEADVIGTPRDGRVETVTVARVALSADDPPYTLYRFWVKSDSTRVVRTPVIENVRSLRFTYFDADGQTVVPPGGSDDDTARAVRASIRRIRVDLRGLVRDPDPRWRDPRDPDPRTWSHRKFGLVVEVTPRNLALVGRSHAP